MKHKPKYDFDIPQGNVGFLASGEYVRVTGITREHGHGIEYQVIYADGTVGYEGSSNILAYHRHG